MSFETILITEESGVLTITLNRPQRRNAITPQMQEELLQALQRAAVGSCRVVVLAGAGEGFCAGLDLSELQGMNDRTDVEYAADAQRIAHLFRTLYELPKPTIASVHGAAVAGGTGLATICDFTVAAEGAKFGYTEAKIGFVPALVSAFLTLQIGEKRARDLLLSGRLFSAEEAHRLGLVNEVVPPSLLQTHTFELAQRLQTSSPEAMAATKRLLVAQNKPWLDVAMEHAMAANAEARTTHDFREGVAAFLEKRKPIWKE